MGAASPGAKPCPSTDRALKISHTEERESRAKPFGGFEEAVLPRATVNSRSTPIPGLRATLNFHLIPRTTSNPSRTHPLSTGG